MLVPRSTAFVSRRRAPGALTSLEKCRSHRTARRAASANARSRVRAIARALWRGPGEGFPGDTPGHNNAQASGYARTSQYSDCVAALRSPPTCLSVKRQSDRSKTTALNRRSLLAPRSTAFVAVGGLPSLERRGSACDAAAQHSSKTTALKGSESPSFKINRHTQYSPALRSVAAADARLGPLRGARSAFLAVRKCLAFRAYLG